MKKKFSNLCLSICHWQPFAQTNGLSPLFYSRVGKYSSRRNFIGQKWQDFWCFLAGVQFQKSIPSMKITFILAFFTTFSANCAQFESKTVNFQRFAAALAKVESYNNPKAIGDKGRAIGLLQIQSKCFQDACKYDKELAKFQYKDCFDSRVAVRVLYSYCSRYEPVALKNGDWETCAKLWNGGCNWRSKPAKVKIKLENYWQKVSSNL